jgi:ribose transport system substrate-binding protein
VQGLKDGTIDVMLVQDPFRLGYEAVKSLTVKLSGRTPARRLDLPARAIVKADLDQPDVRALLFPDWQKGQ